MDAAIERIFAIDWKIVAISIVVAVLYTYITFKIEKSASQDEPVCPICGENCEEPPYGTCLFEEE